MTLPIRLIAEREFRAYTTTVTFWVALAIGPLLTGLCMAALVVLSGAVTNISVRADDRGVRAAAQAAVAEVAALEARKIAFSAAAAPTDDQVIVSGEPGGPLTLRFGSRVPLSAEGRVLVARTMEVSLRNSGAQPAVAVASGGPARAKDPRAAARLGLVMILWLTLTGSLGMLLQAVVRERVNRALEGLLATARPLEIVTGKLLGVGAVSALVLAAWLGCGALGVLGGGRVSTLHGALADFADPVVLARAASLYAVAFAFYGFVTVALGAAARDTASAQNLSRPLFGLLLLVFFVALAGASGGEAAWLGWLVYLPPFTPFVLLLAPPAMLTPLTQVVAVAISLAATAVAARFAVGQLRIADGGR
jgi:ABC-type Na+ efflux pump permease subunit